MISSLMENYYLRQITALLLMVGLSSLTLVGAQEGSQDQAAENPTSEEKPVPVSSGASEEKDDQGVSAKGNIEPPQPDPLTIELQKQLLEKLKEIKSKAEEAGDRSSDAEESDGLREKTIYVPYDKLNDVFEKEGRGIFLPYKDFLELWKKAQKKKPVPPKDVPPPAEAVLSGGQYEGEVVGDLARLKVSYQVEALKKKGWSVLPLGMRGVSVESAEVLSASDEQEDIPSGIPGQPAARPLFTGAGGQYAVFFPRPGAYTINMTLAVRVNSKPGERSIHFQIPPAAISQLKLSLPEENPQLKVRPDSAATSVKVKDGKTEVLAYLGNATDINVSWSPPAGKIQEEEALLRASQLVQVHLNERVLRLQSAVLLEILSQEVNKIQMKVPENLQVLSVRGENIREWSHDEATDVLQLELHSGVKKSYNFQVSFERILQSTPESLAIEFPQMQGVLREDGYVGLSYDGSLRVRVNNSTGLSQRDIRELPKALQGGSQTGFRYLAHPLSLTLGVEKILPVVHSQSTSVVVMGTEEDQWIGWVDYKITRSGVFTLKLQVPSVWRPISLGAEGNVEDYQASPLANDPTQQTITVNLTSRAFGNYRLPFKFAREGQASPGEQSIVAPRVLDVESDRGLLGIGAPRSFQLTTLDQERMVSTDVQELFRSGVLSQIPQDSDASLAFTYNDQPANVRVNLAQRKTEIKVTSRLLANVKDSSVDYAQDMEYLIQYAAVDTVSFSAPEALNDRIRIDVRGFKESKIVNTRDGRSVWQVSLQAKVLGIVTLRVSYDQTLIGLITEGEPFKVQVPNIKAESLEGAQVRGETGAIAIRKEGGLEIQTPEADLSGLELIDPRELPSELAQGRIYKSFRYNSPDFKLGLELIFRRYEKLADAVVPLLKVRKHLSNEKSLSCIAVFLVENAGRQSLDVRLPQGSEVLSTLVNSHRVQPSKPLASVNTANAATQGVDLSIPLTGFENATCAIRVDYRVSIGQEMGAMGSVGIQMPTLLKSKPQVPIGKVELDLRVPADYEYVGRSGNLHFKTQTGHDPWETFRQRAWSLLGVRQQAHAKTGNGNSQADPISQVMQWTAGMIDWGKFQDGRLLQFQGYSAEGTLSVSYLGLRTLRFLAGLFFIAALAGSIVIARKRPDDRTLWIGALAVVALLISWLISDARTSFSVSVFFGAVAVLVFLVAKNSYFKLRTTYQGWRAERIALAPDPFLEEAETQTKEPKKSEEVNKEADPAEDASKESESKDEPESSESAEKEEEKPKKKKAKKSKKASEDESEEES